MEDRGTTARAGAGCALVTLGVNTVLMGLLMSSFVQGPYSSHGQELWYRYGSLGFFAAGAILPAIVLFFAKHSPVIIGITIIWMAATFLGFAWYAMMSGGGV